MKESVAAYNSPFFAKAQGGEKKATLYYPSPTQKTLISSGYSLGVFRNAFRIFLSTGQGNINARVNEVFFFFKKPWKQLYVRTDQQSVFSVVCLARCSFCQARFFPSFFMPKPLIKYLGFCSHDLSPKYCLSVWPVIVTVEWTGTVKHNILKILMIPVKKFKWLAYYSRNNLH